MCGILAVIGNLDKEKAMDLSKRQKHRGPDEWGVYESPTGSIMVHERLSIIDLNTGTQPIQGTNDAWVMHNGEIYNHIELRHGILKNHQFRTTCDSEVIVHLYEKFGYDFCHMLDGIFSFVIIDGEKFMAGRDPIGVKPLYYGHDKDGNMYFSSEMKAIADQCISMEAFPPGHYYSSDTGFVRYYNPSWFDYKNCTEDYDLEKLKNALIAATEKRLMSDVPFGVLLSGGLDSSLIASITKKITADSGLELHSFSVGFNADAPDLKAARKVASFIGTTHHEVIFTIEEGIKALEKVIWHLETYDVTTIRAATPMYFLSKYITDMGIKMVLSGEGADEILGGYLYFHNAPSDVEFQKETIRRMSLLSTADCLRADKATMAWGLEARVPFLDKAFLQVAMSMRPDFKRPDRASGKIEKWVLRNAFDSKTDPYLPDEILWRQKEQFSDGVGYGWIDSIREYCNSMVSDKEFATASDRFPHNTPDTKEAFFFRTIFEKYFPEEHSLNTVLKWIPKWQKNTDPSGRAAEVHVNTVV